MSSSDVWAVGYYGGAGWQTLTEHYSNQCPPPSPTPTATGTPTLTDTPSATSTATATDTPIPMLVGHVNWEARPAQPNSLQELPITLTLQSRTTETDYPSQL